MNIKLLLPKWTSHHNQIITASVVWAKKNKSVLEIKKSNLPANCALLVVDDIYKYFFDYADGTTLLDDPNKYLIYYKRSLLEEDKSNYKNLVSLNLQINITISFMEIIKYYKFNDLFTKQNSIEIARSIDFLGIFTNMPHYPMYFSKFLNYEDKYYGGRVIYLTRLWPSDRPRDEQEQQRRIKQNAFRISACGLIKKYFPNSIVGLYPCELAKKVALDHVVDLSITKKAKYIELLSSADIGIADDGLKDTPGWKIGEYAIMQKGIITTPIRTSIQDFRSNVNYLSTYSRDDSNSLLELINKLQDKNRLMEMKHENKLWADKYLNPENYLENLIKFNRNNQF